MRPISKIKSFVKESKGFTLIEMAIVMVIMGLLIASSATAYVQWQTWKRVDTTQSNIEDAKIAIEGFLQQNGRYPCPASLVADRTDGNLYGIEPANDGAGPLFDENCEIALGLGANAGGDFFVVAGSRPANIPYLAPGTSAPVINGIPPVRIGAIPFRMLGLEENQSYDGYRNRLYYAVTEHLASSSSFQQDTGGIDIIDNTGISYTTNAGEAHYIVFSAGINGAGAYNREGVQAPCPAAVAIESQNCDLADATFLFDSYSTSGDVNNLDDVVTFGFSEAPTWQRPEGGDINDGVLYKNLGFGPTASDDPAEEVDVSGTIRVADNPDTVQPEGQIRANSLCDFDDPSDPDCFDISAISGELADGEGMECPNPNEFIVGISNNAPICEVVQIGCQSDRVIIGINGNGTVNCGVPPASCPTQNIDMCGETNTLPNSSSGANITFTAGTNVGNLYTEIWQCNDGAWQRQSTSGLCSCTPATWDYQGNVSCAVGGWGCGDRYSGTRDIQTERVCPSGDVNTVVLRDDCQCETTEQEGTWSCSANWINRWVLDNPAPSGYQYNTGDVTAVSTHQCPGEWCSGLEERSSDCGCENETPWVETRACENGTPAPAEEVITRQFVCSGGEGAGRYGRDETISINTDACVCTEGTTPGPIRACTDGRVPIDPGVHNGVPTIITTSWDGSSCTTSTADAGPETDYCESPPALTCSWKARTGSLPIPAAAALRDGDPCNCEADTGSTPPCERLGQSYPCTCQVN